MKRRALLVLSIFFLLLVACSGGLPPEFPAPDFKLLSLPSKKKVTLAEFKGRPILIYWFTSW
ncbi:MAG: hypothetical protein D6778_04005 [Nitrospirae bacterium]|nr:MAG: hypothetical protein D6778_04005 [Nitrospirota bacterium]